MPEEKEETLKESIVDFCDNWTENKEETLKRYRLMYAKTKPRHKWIRDMLKKKAKKVKNEKEEKCG